MTFIEAAITLLREAGQPMEVDELAQQALDRDLLTRPGKNPVGSMKAGLTRELNKGKQSQVTRVDDDIFALANAGKSAAKAKRATAGKTAAKATSKPATKAKGKAATKGKAASKPAAKAASKPAAKAASNAAKTKAAAKGKAAAKPVAKANVTAKTTPAKSKAAPAPAAATPQEAKPARSPRPAAARPNATQNGAPRERTATEALEAPSSTQAGHEPSAEDAELGGGDARRRRRRRRRGGRDRAREGAESITETAGPTPGGAQGGAAIEMLTDLGPPAPELADVLAPKAPPRRAAELDSPAEDEAEALYADELAASEPAEAFAEYSDEHTADEDRPLLPEITAKGERIARIRERRRRERDERKQRRIERQQTQEEPRRARAEEPRRARAEEPRRARAEEPRGAARVEEPAMVVLDEAEVDAAVDGVIARPGNLLGDGAADALAAIRSGQPVQARQLAQMMRKRQTLPGEPEELWLHLKAALMADEAGHAAWGLRPRVAYRGRDLFVANHGPADPVVAAAEANFNRSVRRLAASTHKTLYDRLGQLTPPELERIAYVLLLEMGWADLQWIKRVPPASYAVARPLAAPGPVLIGVNAGDEPVSRRGVGELRAGVAAKDLISGLLIAPRPLSEAAQRELAREGKSIAVLCGDELVAQLIARGIGVRVRSAPAIYFDDELLREIASG